MTGFESVSRRKLLSLLLASGGFALMGGAGSLLALRGRAPAVAGLSALSAQEYRTLLHLAQALFPPTSDFAFGAEDAKLARAFDDFLATESPWNRSDLKKALFLLEFGPVIFDHRATTFSRLTQTERLAHFEAWAASKSPLRRQVATAFRKFLSLVFYDQPGTWTHIGYDGPLVGGVK